MENTSVLIVEDEIIIAEAIADILTKTGYKNVRIASSVDEAIAAIEERAPSIVLTDIQLGLPKDGIDLGHLLNLKYQIPFIYVTSYSGAETVGKAKFTRPGAYIIKPFKNEDLLVAMELALFNSGNKYRSNDKDAILLVKEGRAMTGLSVRNIMFVEAIGNHSGITISNGRKRIFGHSLNDLLPQLNVKPFMRIHDSYLINCDYITETTGRYIRISGQELPIGKNYQASVSSFFNC